MANNVVYCARCGKPLPIYRKAMPHYGRILDIVEPHECEEMYEIDLGKFVPPPGKEEVEDNMDNKFVQKLNDLKPLPAKAAGDRRPSDQTKKEAVTSSAPSGLLDRWNQLQPRGPEDDSEMGD